MLLIESMLMAGSKIIRTAWPVYTWGQAPALGDGSTVNRSSPVLVCSGFCWTSFSTNTAQRCNQNLIMGIRDNGTLWASGCNQPDPMMPPTCQGAPRSWVAVGGNGGTIGMIDTSGELWMSGSNGCGSLGNGTTISCSSPVLVCCGFTNWCRIRLSFGSTFAIRQGGTFWGWGSNNLGALGLNDTISRSQPVQITAAGNVCELSVTICGGANFAISTTGAMWAWGNNQLGQLGLGTTATQISSPVQVGTSAWSMVAAAGQFAAAIRQDGTLWAWGNNVNGILGQNSTTSTSSPVQIGTLNSWRQIYLGSGSNFVARRSDDTLWTWGVGFRSGIAGPAAGGPCRSSPVQISGTWTRIWGADPSLSKVFARCSASPAAIFGWGWELQIPGCVDTTVSRTFWPTPTLMASTGYTNAGCNSFSTFQSLTDDCIQRVWCNGALGAGAGYCSGSPVVMGDFPCFTTEPSFVQITGTATWCCVSLGGGGVLAIKPDGTLWSWGCNERQMLGQPNCRRTNSPTQVGTLSWKSVVASQTNAAGISSAGNLYVWGIGGGIFTSDNVSSTRCSWIQVANGCFNTFAIRSDFTLWAWGRQCGGNSFGNGQFCFQASSPVQIGTDLWKCVITNQFSNTFAIRQNGTLWAWGCDCIGSLGVGGGVTYGQASCPVQVGTSIWSAVTANGCQTLAIRQDNTLWAWGSTAAGALGLNSTQNPSSPVQVGTSTWLAICTKASTTIGLRSDNTVWTWGCNNCGQLGQNNTTNRSSPVQILSGLTICCITTGGVNRTSAAIETNGCMWLWGSNSYGRLGLGDTTPRSSPVALTGGACWCTVEFPWQSSVAISCTGRLFGWGRSPAPGSGPLPNIFGSPNSPVAACGIPGTVSFTALASGDLCGERMFAIQSQGTLWAWGNNVPWGVLGLGQVFSDIGNGGTCTVGGGWFGSNSPVQIGTSIWSAVALAGLGRYGASIFAIRQDNTLWSWGDNSFGRLGINCNDRVLAVTSSPVQIGTSSWSVIRANRGHVGGILTNGELYMWGSGTYGVLGINTTTAPACRSSPTQVGTECYSSVSVSVDSSGAIRTDGTLWTWGRGCLGVLGQGATNTRLSPVQVGTSCWSAITMGNSNFAVCVASVGLLDA